MNSARLFDLVRNCFWLLVPILVLNLLLTRDLPAAFQLQQFWRGIPAAIAIPENALRAVVMILPVFFRLGIASHRQQLGLWIYLAGLTAYASSWIVLVAAPQSAWAHSAFGFMAPAYTPAIWLAGIALVGEEVVILRLHVNAWIYLSCAALFLVFHNFHTGLVYSRGV